MSKADRPATVLVYSDDRTAGWALAILQAMESRRPDLSVELSRVAQVEELGSELDPGSGRVVVVGGDDHHSQNSDETPEGSFSEAGADGAASVRISILGGQGGVQTVRVAADAFDADLDELCSSDLLGDIDHGPARTGRWRSWFRWRPAYTRIGEVFGILTGVAFVVALLASQFRSNDVDVRLLDGDVTVAVAGFAVGDGSENLRNASDDVALALWSGLEENLGERAARAVEGATPLSVDVLSPEESEPLEGSALDAVADRADALARRHRADSVLSAVVSDDGRSIQPILYLAPTSLPNALELAGLYEFGSAVEVRSPIADNSAARAEVREALVGRSASAAELLMGLRRLENGQFSAAEDNLETALELWPGERGRDLVYLFLGNVSIKTEDYAAARTALESGLRSRTEPSPRLNLALLEVQFHEARGDCVATGREDDLVDVRSGYDALTRMTASSSAKEFAARVQFGLGRSTLCLASLGSGVEWGEAVGHYVAVIQSDADETTTDIRAESYGGLAVIADRVGVTWNPDICASSTTCYERAASTAVDPERRKTFLDLAEE